MNSPYQKYLKSKIGQKVTLHRNSAADLEGEVVKADAEAGGCVIKQAGPKMDSKTTVFVAFVDIRGVANVDWDL